MTGLQMHGLRPAPALCVLGRFGELVSCAGAQCAPQSTDVGRCMGYLSVLAYQGPCRCRTGSRGLITSREDWPSAFKPFGSGQHARPRPKWSGSEPRPPSASVSKVEISTLLIQPLRLLPGSARSLPGDAAYSRSGLSSPRTFHVI